MNWGSAIRKCGKLMLVSDQNQLYTGVRICNPRIAVIQGGEIIIESDIYTSSIRNGYWSGLCLFFCMSLDDTNSYMQELLQSK